MARVYKARTVAETIALYSEPDTNGGCTLWSGSVGANGYGLFVSGGKNYAAHRASWSCANGEIAAGLFVCHRCDNPLCINPDHLFLGTHRENMADMDRKGRRNRSGVERDKNGRTKVSSAQLQDLRRKRADGVKLRQIAASYGVSESQAWALVRGVHWPRKSRR